MQFEIMKCVQGFEKANPTKSLLPKGHKGYFKLNQELNQKKSCLIYRYSYMFYLGVSTV